MRYPRTATALLAVGLCGALALWWGLRNELNDWDAMHFAVLLYGALLSAALASALAWRHEHPLLRLAPRVLALTLALVWMYTWCESLQRFAAWLSRLRYLWLEV